MTNTAYLFPTTQPFVNVLDKVLDKYLEPHQYDAHVWYYRTIMRAYGSVEGWHQRQLELKMKHEFARLCDEGELS